MKLIRIALLLVIIVSVLTIVPTLPILLGSLYAIWAWALGTLILFPKGWLPILAVALIATFVILLNQ